MAVVYPVVMPKWGMEMTEGLLAKWHFKEGDTVKKGDELADIETDKLSNIYEAEFDGAFVNVTAKEGETYPVGALLAVIAEDGASKEDIAAFVSSYKPPDIGGEEPAPVEPAGYATMPAEAAPPAPLPEPSATPSPAPAPRPAVVANGGLSAEKVLAKIEKACLDISPVAARAAAAAGVDVVDVKGTGRKGRISLADVEALAETSLVRETNAANASPIARRLAKQNGIDLARLRGSGPRGRVLKKDVLAAQSMSTHTAAVSADPSTYRAEPLSNMRRGIARRLVQAKLDAPHIYLRAEFRMGELMKTRAQVNTRLAGKKISVNDLLVRASALALRDVPDANAQFAGEEIRYFEQADIGVAVALDGGLVTPIIKAADRKSVFQISEEIADMAQRARSGRLKPADIEGGTFSVTNLGMYGLSGFDAVINPPQGAILALGAVEERPANVDGELALADMMNVTMSCDHRVIDGAVGASYLAALKDLVENPVSLVM